MHTALSNVQRLAAVHTYGKRAGRISQVLTPPQVCLLLSVHVALLSVHVMLLLEHDFVKGQGLRWFTLPHQNHNCRCTQCARHAYFYLCRAC